MSIQYLLKLKNRYYFRIAVPSDLVDVIKVSELKRTLSTGNIKLVRCQLASYTLKAEQLFCFIRSGILTEAEVPTYLQKNFPSRYKRPSRSNEMRVSDVVNFYVKEKELLGDWTPKTAEENKSILNRFVEMIHDCALASVDRKKMIEIVTVLSNLPANVRKYPRFERMTFEEIASLPDVVPMSAVSVNKNLNRIRGLFLWCKREGYVERDPSQGLSLKRTKNPYEEREAYDQSDLQRMIDSLLSVPYTNPERFWIPLIAMHSGLRQNEICQLYVEDIIEEDGVACFDINASHDKSIKTLSSKRLVPLHPKLISYGLLDYKSKMKEAGEPRMWPNLMADQDGYIRNFVNWYYRHNRRHITKNPKRTFHSLRHTFADSLKQRGIAEGIISELMGHSNKSITTGRYGKPFRPENLLKAVEQLDYSTDDDSILRWLEGSI